MAESKYTIRVTKTQRLSIRKDLPQDYHCECEYCTKKFLGEIYDVQNDTYYSQIARNQYYIRNAGKHIAPGHWQGYRYAIQRFTKKGDWVFDPTVGTGTAIVEAINNGRNGLGIELEFGDLTEKNIQFQYAANNKPKGIGKYHLWNGGNARNLSEYLTSWRGEMNEWKEVANKEPLENQFLSLVINGTPYPKIAGVSSDGYERAFSRDVPDQKDKIRDYQIEENFGSQRLTGNYWPWVIQMYLDSIPHLKKNGKIVIIIKDLVQKKKPWLLHQMIIDRILERTDELKYFGSFMHKHIPSTMFINTYNKRFPDVKIPRYQTGIVLRKR